MTQSTKSMFASAYFSMMSMARPKSSVIGKTKRGRPSNAKRTNVENSLRPTLRMVMYANSGKTGVGSKGLRSVAIACKQLSWAASFGARSASTKPVSSSAVINASYLDRVSTLREGRFRQPEFLRPFPRPLDLPRNLFQSRENAYAPLARLRWMVSAVPTHCRQSIQFRTRWHLARNNDVGSKRLLASLGWDRESYQPLHKQT